MIIEGYKADLTGTREYDFYLNGKLICSQISLLAPSGFVTVRWDGKDYVSKYDMELSVAPGVSRSVRERRTQDEAWRIIYESMGHYSILIGKERIKAKIGEGQTDYYLGSRKIASMVRCSPSLAGYAGNDRHLYFRAEISDDTSYEMIPAILTLPLLRFGF